MSQPTPTRIAFVGGYSRPDEGGIQVLANSGDGWRERQTLASTNPTYLVIDGPGERLYASHSGQSYLSAFSIDQETAELSLINSQSTSSTNPAHLALSPDGAWVVAASFSSGHVSVLPIEADGSLGELSSLLSTAGDCGPRPEQSSSQPHQIVFADGHVLVPDRGRDLVHIFNWDNGKLTPTAPGVAPVGSGPRHLAIHPTLPIAYLVGELDSTMISFSWDAGAGTLTSPGVVSSLPDDFDGSNSGAAIAISRDGQFVYGSNRGHDSICRIPLDDLGRMQAGARTWIPAGGQTPRFVTLAAGDRELWSAAQDSDLVTVVDLAGRRPNEVIAAVRPSCVALLDAAGTDH